MYRIKEFNTKIMLDKSLFLGYNDNVTKLLVITYLEGVRK